MRAAHPAQGGCREVETRPLPLQNARQFLESAQTVAATWADETKATKNSSALNPWSETRSIGGNAVSLDGGCGRHSRVHGQRSVDHRSPITHNALRSLVRPALLKHRDGDYRSGWIGSRTGTAFLVTKQSLDALGTSTERCASRCSRLSLTRPEALPLDQSAPRGAPATTRR